MIEGAIHNMYFLRLLSDPIPFIEIGIIDLRYAYTLWLLILFFLLIGFKTRVMAVANYVLMVALLSSLTTFQYHFDYASITLGLFLVFFPSNQTYSIDSLIQKIKGKPFKVETRQLYYFLVIFFTLGIVYIASMSNKLTSWMYLNGLGVWLPASMPQNAYLDLTTILNWKYFMLFLGYMVLVYESLFCFLFFRKKWRIPLLIVGSGLHLGITFAYPIPEFGLICAVGLIFLMPLRWFNWKPKFGFLKSFEIRVFFDGKCRLCQGTKIAVKHFDFFDLIQFVEIQELPEDHTLFTKTDRTSLLKSMFSLSVKNKAKDGIYSYRRIFLRIWFTIPLGLLLYLPGISHLGQFIYKKVADNRYKVCNEDSCEIELTSTAIPIKNENETPELSIVRNFKVGAIFAVSIFLILIQVFFTIKDDYSVQLLAKKMGREDIVLDFRGNHTADSFGRYWTKLTGMSAHGVFLYERHFKNYDHLVAITYQEKDGNEKWVPLYRPNGLVGSYNMDRFWLKWNFRSNSRNCNNEELATGIKLFTAYWAGKNSIPLDTARFNVKVKFYDPINGWEHNYLKKQLEKEWHNVGYVEYLNNEYFTDSLPIIEDLKKEDFE